MPRRLVVFRLLFSFWNYFSVVVVFLVAVVVAFVSVIVVAVAVVSCFCSLLSGLLWLLLLSQLFGGIVVVHLAGGFKLFIFPIRDGWSTNMFQRAGSTANQVIFMATC